MYPIAMGYTVLLEAEVLGLCEVRERRACNPFTIPRQMMAIHRQLNSGARPGISRR